MVHADLRRQRKCKQPEDEEEEEESSDGESSTSSEEQSLQIDSHVLDRFR